MAYEDILNERLAGWFYSREEIPENKIEDYLTYVDEIELDGESYQFHLIRFYVRKSDGQILYATDSGCSCPMPFEDTYVKDLKETTLAGVEQAVLDNWSDPEFGHGWWDGVSRAEIQREIRDIKKALEAAGGK